MGHHHGCRGVTAHRGACALAFAIPLVFAWLSRVTTSTWFFAHFVLALSSNAETNEERRDLSGPPAVESSIAVEEAVNNCSPYRAFGSCKAQRR